MILRITLAIVLSVSTFIVSAQWSNGTNIYNTNSGNVGIGTGSTVNSKFEIRGPSFRLSDATTRYLEISQDANGQPYGRNWTNNYAGGRQFKISGFSHLPDNSGSVKKDIIHFDGYNLFLLPDNGGSLGIGTTTPNAKVEVVSDVSFFRFRGSAYSANTPMDILNLGYSGPTGAMNVSFRLGYPYSMGVMSGARLDLLKILNGTTVMCTNENGESLGNLAIGTTDAKGYKLAVAGKIISEEVVVKLQSNWPDYVFEDDYKLPSLTEVALYVKKNKHLPDMPSAGEVESDGVKLSEMNRLLLKKVEELTLYLIELQQSNEALKKRIEVLEQK